MNVMYEKIVLRVYVKNEKIINLLLDDSLCPRILFICLKEMDEESFYPYSIIKR